MVPQAYRLSQLFGVQSSGMKGTAVKRLKEFKAVRWKFKILGQNHVAVYIRRCLHTSAVAGFREMCL